MGTTQLRCLQSLRKCVAYFLFESILVVFLMMKEPTDHKTLFQFVHEMGQPRRTHTQYTMIMMSRKRDLSVSKTTFPNYLPVQPAFGDLARRVQGSC